MGLSLSWRDLWEQGHMQVIIKSCNIIGLQVAVDWESIGNNMWTKIW